MKRVLLCLLLCWASSAFAQNAGIVSGSQLSVERERNQRSVFTIEAGADVIWINPSEDLYNYTNGISRKTGVGFHLRGLYKLRLSDNLPLYAHTGLGLAYHRDGGVTVNPGDDMETMASLCYRLLYLQIPLGIEYRFSLGKQFALMPYLGFNFNVGLYSQQNFKFKNGSIGHGYDQFSDGGDLRRFRPDVTLGVNAEWGRFIVGTGVQIGLTNMLKQNLVDLYESENAGSPKMTYTGWTISVGYRF